MSPKKLKKKKDHEKEAHKKVLARRAALRAPKIEENKMRRKINRVEKLKKAMQGRLGQYSDDVLLNMSETTLTQLEKNAQILDALESEYERERSKKSKLNLDLESKGLFTLNDKLSYLHDQFVEQQKAEGVSFIDEDANLTDLLKKPKKEVAEVTLSRAPEAS